MGLAVSRNGTVATADTGPERFGITVIEPPGKNGWRERHIWARTPNGVVPEVADPDWKHVTDGIAFEESGKSIWISEGAAGRIREIDWNSGDTRKTISLNTPERGGSVTGAMAPDNAHRLLYVVDRGNSRVAVIDLKAGRVVSWVPIDRPSAVVLAPDAATLYVTNTNSVCIVDVREPLKPQLGSCLPIVSPTQVAATDDRVFVSSAENDSVTVIDPHTHAVIAEIPLRIPSLEQYRGIEPAGMAYDPVTKWLLVAETGINAVGVVDMDKNVLIGHLPAGWMPTRIAISGERVFVTNAAGRGTGPTNRHVILELGEEPSLYHGTVTTFIMPDKSEILAHTGVVFTNNGFVPWMHDPPRLPDAIRHVVLIEKEGRTFDEVMGDVESAANGKILSFPRLARFGVHGYADGGKTRFSVQDASVTPNHHAIAHDWAFSDNFYLGGDEMAFSPVFKGDWWRQTRSAGFTREIFEYADATSDQARADRFIADIEGRYGKGGQVLPQFVYVHLDSDGLPGVEPSRGYPYEASWMEDNDLALGRIVDYLSHSPWWPGMAVFITERETQDGLDHIDSHRTILLAASPYVKRNYVSHMNSNGAGLRRTILQLLHLPPMNLADATAAGLNDMFTQTPDLTPFTALAPDARIFDPAAQVNHAVKLN